SVSFVFFFSSRRRHTRFSRDWSSDVCSSDLEVYAAGLGGRGLLADLRLGRDHLRARLVERRAGLVDVGLGDQLLGAEVGLAPVRSEERRVGEEGGREERACIVKEAAESQRAS